MANCTVVRKRTVMSGGNTYTVKLICSLDKQHGGLCWDESFLIEFDRDGSSESYLKSSSTGGYR